jgi:peptidoglycan/xylan/chitin deacetylase (PgdA/CDA1 family)
MQHAVGRGQKTGPWRRLALAALAVIVLSFGGAFGMQDGAATPAGSPTVVSLTFDDGTTDQYQVRSLLASHGMKGVFYVNSGRIGLPGYMTQQQLADIASDGNEIGGHTVSHADLPTLPADEQQRQVCNDRSTLLGMGLQVYDFAYPFGDLNSATQGIVQGCGYNSGRALGGIVSPTSCAGCPYAEPNPPQAPYGIRTPDSIKSTATVADLQNSVTQAEANGGGWLALTFHHVCSGSGCNTLSVDPAVLSSFLDWLQARATPVQTVHDVVGGSLQPAVSGPPPAFDAGVLQNGSLEAPATGDTPDCWKLGGTGTTTATGQRTSDAHTGSYGYRIDATSIPAGTDKKLHSTQDLGSCAPSANPGDVYSVSAWYKGNAAVRLVSYYRNSLGGWVFWAQQPANLPAASDWAKGSWQLPAVPDGATAISVAMSVRSAGSVTMDDFSLQPGDTVAPSVTIASPAEGATVTGKVTLTANASDNVGVTKVDFFVGGKPVGSATSAPWQVVWDAGTATQSNLGITARAWDTAGNSANSPGVNVTVAAPPPTPPTGSVLVQNPSLETSANGSVPDCWQLGSSGTNTATWLRSTASHTGSFAESVEITDWTSGDRKLVVKQDSGACAPSVGSGATYQLSGWYKSTAPTRFVLFTRNATTGVWSFWSQSPALAASVDWTKATWTTPAVPAGASSLSFGLNIAAVGTLAVDDFDLVPSDTQAPTVSLTSPADASTVKGAVTLSANASDDVGVTKVEFLVDGGVVGTAASAPFSMSWDSATVGNGSHTFSAKAYDATGNITTSISATVNVDNADHNAPTVALTAPAAGATVSGQLTLTANAADDVAMNRVEFYAGTKLIATVSSAPYETVWNSADEANGPVTLTAKAYDAAGNAASDAVTVTVSNQPADTTPPATTIACGGSSCSNGWYAGPVSVSLAATDADSGVAKTRYTLDGSIPTEANGIDYTGAITVSATATVQFRSWDNAGNAEPVQSRKIQIDTAAPTAAAPSCNGGGCGPWFTQAVTVRLNGSDTGGSGLDRIVYTTDGSTPTASHSTVYSGPFTVSATTTVKYVAIDAAGNSSAVQSQQVRIDTVAPSLSSTQPAAGSTVSGTVQVKVTASDAGGSGMSSIAFYLDDVRQTTASGTGPNYQWAWNTKKSSKGQHTVKAVASDAAGNTKTVAITVTVA